MTAVVGIVSAGLFIFILALASTAYAYKTRKRCFRDVNSSTKPAVSPKDNKIYQVLS